MISPNYGLFHGYRTDLALNTAVLCVLICHPYLVVSMGFVMGFFVKYVYFLCTHDKSLLIGDFMGFESF
jgi:hypothetical protein